jgi:hypothetical protein
MTEWPDQFNFCDVPGLFFGSDLQLASDMSAPPPSPAPANATATKPKKDPLPPLEFTEAEMECKGIVSQTLAPLPFVTP